MSAAHPRIVKTRANGKSWSAPTRGTLNSARNVVGLLIQHGISMSFRTETEDSVLMEFFEGDQESCVEVFDGGQTVIVKRQGGKSHICETTRRKHSRIPAFLKHDFAAAA